MADIERQWATVENFERTTPAKTVADGAELPPLPLCVDLDGTLVKSDTLLDSLLVMVRQKPFSLLLLPVWVLQAKPPSSRTLPSLSPWMRSTCRTTARFCNFLNSSTPLDAPSTLPLQRMKAWRRRSPHTSASSLARWPAMAAPTSPARPSSPPSAHSFLRDSATSAMPVPMPPSSPSAPSRWWPIRIAACGRLCAAYSAYPRKSS